MDLDPFAEILAMALKCWKIDLRDAFLVLIGSGLRRGELLALRWQDCDLAGGLLHVRPQRSTGWTPKTKRARAVGIPAWAVEILTRRQSGGGAGPFLDAKGKPIMDPSTLSHGWVRLARRHGRPHIRLHDLRHAHATEALERGANIRAVQVQLGHTRVTTTERYTHVDRQSPRRVAELFDDVLPRAAETG
jgi:integrase